MSLRENIGSDSDFEVDIIKDVDIPELENVVITSSMPDGNLPGKLRTENDGTSPFNGIDIPAYKTSSYRYKITKCSDLRLHEKNLKFANLFRLSNT